MKSSSLLFLTAISFFPLGGEAIAEAPPTAPLGVNLDSLTDWSPQQMFVDLMKTARMPFGTVEYPWDGSGQTPVGDDGWPLGDFGVVLSSNPIDGGKTYSLSFEGQATYISTYGMSIVRNLNYDPNANLTTADLDVYPDTGIMLGFSGVVPSIKNLKVRRPGYSPDQTFTTPFLKLLDRFRVVRFMDYLQTNGNEVAQWSQRTLPTSPSQAVRDGGAWEYVIQLANEADKDIWINIPALADDDYVRQLAQLLKTNLAPGRTVYLEYSNEVWNFAFGFEQSRQNLEATRREAITCSGEGQNLTCECDRRSNLCAFDGDNNDYYLAWRRVARRIIEIGNIFESVYGSEAMMNTIRPVLATQMFGMVPWQQLYFIRNVYGPPSQYLYALAIAPYFGPFGSINGPTREVVENPSASVDELLESMTLDVEEMLKISGEYDLAAYNGMARAFGLRLISYEGGLDTGQGEVNLDNKIACSFDPRMTDILTKYLSTWSGCLGVDGNLLTYYNLASVYSQYGQWGLTDNINIPSVKTAAIDDMVTRNPASFECSTVPYDPVAPAPGAGEGLSASYYRDASFNQLAGTQVDSTVDFYWWNISWALNPTILPAPMVGAYSVVWTGSVEPKYSETYTFYTHADHAIRLIVNEVPLVSDKSEHDEHDGPIENSGTIALEANQRYPIRIEYYSPGRYPYSGAGGTVSLLWSSASQPKAKVARSQLYPF